MGIVCFFLTTKRPGCDADHSHAQKYSAEANSVPTHIYIFIVSEEHVTSTFRVEE
jgi:hypothetical protein